MEIVKAVQRLGWRFSEASKRGNTFTINETDVKALQSIGKYVEQTQRDQYESNELFAKLYIYLYTKVLANDKTTVFDTSAKRKIGNLLKKPITQLIEELTQSLNESEIYEVLQEVGATHPAIRTEAETNEQNAKLKELMSDPINESRLLGDVWDYETVKKAMEREINFMINNFR